MKELREISLSQHSGIIEEAPKNKKHRADLVNLVGDLVEVVKSS